jgi:hypothetical protein
MKLNAGKFAMAVASVWAVAGLFCAIVFKAAPEAYARAANFLLHTNMYRPVRTVGWGELVLALVAWWVISAVLAGAAAAAYNGLLRNTHEAAVHPKARMAAKV